MKHSSVDQLANPLLTESYGKELDVLEDCFRATAKAMEGASMTPADIYRDLGVRLNFFEDDLDGVPDDLDGEVIIEDPDTVKSAAVDDGEAEVADGKTVPGLRV